MNSIFFPIFETMSSVNPEINPLETLSFPSEILERNLRIDFYLPPETEVVKPMMFCWSMMVRICRPWTFRGF